MSTSPTAQVRLLWSEGFFQDPKSLQEVQQRLADRHLHPENAALRMALSRAEFLRPDRANGSTTFVQKFPADATIAVGKGKKQKHDGWSLLHPEVAKVAQSRLEAGNLADAVEAGIKLVNKRIRQHVLKNHKKELDGTKLMSAAFSVNNPLIALDDLSQQSGKDAQEGYMHLFMGAILGIRNPKAHDFVTLSPDRAMRLLIFASALMYKLDEAKVPAL